MNSHAVKLYTRLIPLVVAVVGCDHSSRAWEDASQENSIESYQAYLDKYPNAANASEATTRKLQLAEEADWEAAKAGNVDTLNSFLARYPASSKNQEARRRITAALLDWDVKSILVTMRASQNQNSGVPGSVYRLGVDLPYHEKSTIYLKAFDTCTFSADALAGGEFRVGDDRTMYLNGSAKVTVQENASVVMILYIRVSQSDVIIDGGQTSTAVVDSVNWRLLPGSNEWTLIDH